MTYSRVIRIKYGARRAAELFACALVSSLFAPTALAEWVGQSCSFGHRIPATITAGASGNDQEIRIDLVSADFPADYVFSSDGDDIRIFEDDDVTPVDFLVTGWDDAARTATIFVRLPVMAGAAVETVYIYGGSGRKRS